MWLSLALLVPTLLCLQVSAWVGVIESEKTTTSHCFTSSHDIGAMDENETVRIKDMCAKAVCRSDRTISLTGCGPLPVVEPPCYADKGDLKKPFPECCFEIRCLETYGTPTPPNETQ